MNRYDVLVRPPGWLGDTENELKLYSFCTPTGAPMEVWVQVTGNDTPTDDDQDNFNSFMDGTTRNAVGAVARRRLMEEAVTYQSAALGCLALLGGGQIDNFIHPSPEADPLFCAVKRFWVKAWMGYTGLKHGPAPNSMIKLVGGTLSTMLGTCLVALSLDPAVESLVLSMLIKDEYLRGYGTDLELTHKGYALRTITQAAIDRINED
jgi:hypothetical protein